MLISKALERANPYIITVNAFIDHSTTQRVFLIAKPFLSLNPLAKRVINVGTGISQSWTEIKGLPELYEKGDWTQLGQKSIYLAVLVVRTACVILFPIEGIILWEGIELIRAMYAFGLSIQEKQASGLIGKGAIMVSLKSIDWTASVVKVSELCILNGILQASQKVFISYQEFSKGTDRIPEGVANLLLAGIGAAKTAPHIENVYNESIK